MHDVFERGVEDYLAGSASREFESHLAQCASCREELDGFVRVAGMLGALRAVDGPGPSLGFSNRVMVGIHEQKGRSFWGAFTIDPSFARKIAFASLLSLAILGSYLATQSADSMALADHTPEAVLASHDVSAPSDDPQKMDGMLVTLATYQTVR
jgi:hypothetical protein